ncbi:MAG: hypothetical protein COX90_01050 [Candidatus Nealsonbacteria bacterium CG_4_10_14_0_2_um_filter_38_17]|uniref:Uncharacterized protein n=2 Tax=Candidatus Nealsoniibacteriota TaxID=1817911 RepID=A0A2M7UYU1_9BACT|nr:MAG: hypothetical protein COX36_00360 [Candidatus Nealsonbacteria bacterium CG23_combo_of_CG06-09_8_20_14_all_38_19]PIZ89146.1 MAG: hypothetical protein COX90_01050 [Candidatus Nealsonbacteria bacterium CG_4_10_14_0_2_um_filter_38_17]
MRKLEKTLKEERFKFFAKNLYFAAEYPDAPSSGMKPQKELARRDTPPLRGRGSSILLIYNILVLFQQNKERRKRNDCQENDGNS